ncbi:glyoxylate/hydroxypyruvate reductase A [Gammaproteobacteria bacterium]|nr:glyoxylate/hydroxypyruvate reductase A [Gammaproteobacteria bacterium]
MIKVLFSASQKDWKKYKTELIRAMDDTKLVYEITTDLNCLDANYIIYAPSGGLEDFSNFKSLKAILSLWAGVENITGNTTIKVPLCRMVDTGLTQGMVEWVTGHVLRHHLDLDKYIKVQDGVWRNNTYPPLASDRNLTILGLGELGLSCAKTLSDLNFKVHGWSRSQKNNIGNIKCYFGNDGLIEALSRAEILILLLPLTKKTNGLIDERMLSKMPYGSIILNPGRGHLINDSALLRAIESGQVSRATLDVFEIEPLPKEHPYWVNEKVTVTPHIASVTRASSSCDVIAKNILRGERGDTFLYLVDRKKGY